MARLIACARSDAREAGNELAESVPRNESVKIVPAAHIFAWSGQAGALAIDLQEPVVIEGEIVSVKSVVLPLERAACEVDRRVWQFAQRFARCRRRGSLGKSDMRQCRCGRCHFNETTA